MTSVEGEMARVFMGLLNRIDGEPYPPELVNSACPSYGLMVVPLGDDRDVALILGHHGMLRAVAALNQYSRTVDGLLNMFDDLSMGYADAVADIECRWAKMLTQCRRADQPGHTENCETCWAISYEVKSGGWWVQYDYDQDEPGVFPVMVWHA